MNWKEYMNSDEGKAAYAQYQAKNAQPNITQVAGGGGYDPQKIEEARNQIAGHNFDEGGNLIQPAETAQETPIAPPVEQSAAPQETSAQTQTGEATRTPAPSFDVEPKATGKENRKAARQEKRENADFKDVTAGSVAANALALPLALMGVNLPELNQQIREQRYMRTSKLGEEYKDAMASGDEKKMDDWMTKLQQRNFDHTNTGQRYGTKIADLLAAQGKEKVMNYLATAKPDRNKMVSDLFADMKKEYSGNPKYYLKTLEEQMALRHARQNELAKIGVDETRAEADKTKAETDAFGDLRKGTQWFTYEADASKNYGLPDGYTIGQGGNTAKNSAGDVLHLRQDSKGDKFWAKEEDANLKWKAELEKARAAGKALDREGFEKHMAEVNKEQQWLIGRLRSFISADIGVYDLETQGAAKISDGDLEKLKKLAGENATEIEYIIRRMKDIDDEFSRLKQANVLSLLGYPPDIQLSAFTANYASAEPTPEKRASFYKSLQESSN